jgi:hypothetical protein
MRTETDRILLEAAAAGASLDDLATIAGCAIENWRAQRPDPDAPEDGFDDRFVQAGTTFGGAGVIRGNLTPECASAVRAVLEALGKKAGPEDDRDEGKRFHDALQMACELLLRAKLVPDRAGAAAALRCGLLEKPWNTPSLPLDIGYSDAIPAHIRRAVTLRDRHCAWPGCDRPPVHCDVHHLTHKSDGGDTSVANCALVCQYHHDVCIHRRGWTLKLNPDGTTEAASPGGRHVLRSHAPPGTAGSPANADPPEPASQPDA